MKIQIFWINIILLSLTVGNYCLPIEKQLFKLFNIPHTWNEARCFCSHYSMTLLTLRNAEEIEVYSHIRNQMPMSEVAETNDEWIGLYYNQEEKYTWVTGEYLGQWSNWHSTEPNFQSSDLCIRQVTETNEFRTMTCDDAYNFVCQMKKGPCTMEFVHDGTIETTKVAEEKSLSLEECLKLCSQDTSGTKQCYAVEHLSPTNCRIYRTTQTMDFINPIDILEQHVTASSIYRKICYEGTLFTDTLPNYIDSSLRPSLSCTLQPITSTAATTTRTATTSPQLIKTSTTTFTPPSKAPTTSTTTVTSSPSTTETTTASSSPSTLLTTTALPSPSTTLTTTASPSPSTTLTTKTTISTSTSSFTSNRTTLLSATTTKTTRKTTEQAISTTTTSQSTPEQSTGPPSITSTVITKTTKSFSFAPVTSPALNNTVKECKCYCSQKYTRREDLRTQEIKKTEQLLIINKRTTSMYRRSLSTAQDDRLTSKAIGSFGIIIIGVIFLLLVLGDLNRICVCSSDRYARDSLVI